MRKRNIGKFVYLDEREAADLASKAARTGLSESALIRLLIQGYAPKEKPDDRFYIVMRQLIGIGNNIQQICRKANALNFIDAPAIAKEAKKWDDFWLEVRRKYLDPEKYSGDN